jgi:hypothetical protein
MDTSVFFTVVEIALAQMIEIITTPKHHKPKSGMAPITLDEYLPDILTGQN